MAGKDSKKETKDDNAPEKEGGDAAAVEEGGKKSKKKLIIIIAAALFVVLAGGGAAAFFLLKKDKTEEAAAAGEHGAEGEAGKDGHGDAAAKDPHAEEDEDGEVKKPAKKAEKKDDHKEAKKEGGGHGDDKGGKPESNFIDLPDMVVNLDSPGKRQNFLKLKIKLELDDPGDKAAIEAVMPRVVDQFQTYLRELRVEDLRGSAGVYRLRQELLARVQPAVAPVQVNDILFQEILVQ